MHVSGGGRHQETRAIKNLVGVERNSESKEYEKEQHYLKRSERRSAVNRSLDAGDRESQTYLPVFVAVVLPVMVISSGCEIMYKHTFLAGSGGASLLFGGRLC